MSTSALTGSEDISTKLHTRLRISGVLVLLALLIFAVSLLWSHPTAFLLFMFAGGALLAAGVLFYLYTLATHSATPGQED